MIRPHNIYVIFSISSISAGTNRDAYRGLPVFVKMRLIRIFYRNCWDVRSQVGKSSTRIFWRLREEKELTSASLHERTASPWATTRRPSQTLRTKTRICTFYLHDRWDDELDKQSITWPSRGSNADREQKNRS